MVAACSWCSASHAKAPVRAVEGSGSPGRAAALSKQTKAPEIRSSQPVKQWLIGMIESRLEWPDGGAEWNSKD